MEELRNLPPEPAALSALIEYQPGTVVSMALSRHPNVSITLFAFDAGNSISTEYYLGDTLYLVLEGQMELLLNEKAFLLPAGACMRIPAKQQHAIGGKACFKLLQITLNEME